MSESSRLHPPLPSRVEVLSPPVRAYSARIDTYIRSTIDGDLRTNRDRMTWWREQADWAMRNFEELRGRLRYEELRSGVEVAT